MPGERIKRGAIIMPMSIPKAIEILTDWGVISKPQVDQDLLDAVKLGIEALKYIKDQRAEWLVQVFQELPGETDA